MDIGFVICVPHGGCEERFEDSTTLELLEFCMSDFAPEPIKKRAAKEIHRRCPNILDVLKRYWDENGI